jgi:hypothetical protein
MVTPKQLALIASFVFSGLLLADPARALTPIAQPFFVSGGEGSMDVQPIKQRRCHGYRNGQRVYRSCMPGRHKVKRKSSWYGTSQNSGYNKPWSGIQLCENCPAIK